MLRERDSKFEYGPSSKVEFEGDEISLDIPNGTIDIDGWRMKCHNKNLVYYYDMSLSYVKRNNYVLSLRCLHVQLFQVRKVDVDDYNPCKTLVTCQVRMRWVQEDVTPTPLSHDIKLLGAKVFDFLTVTSPSRCIGMWYRIIMLCTM